MQGQEWLCNSRTTLRGLSDSRFLGDMGPMIGTPFGSTCTSLCRVLVKTEIQFQHLCGTLSSHESISCQPASNLRCGQHCYQMLQWNGPCMQVAPLHTDMLCMRSHHPARQAGRYHGGISSRPAPRRASICAARSPEAARSAYPDARPHQQSRQQQAPHRGAGAA